MIVRSVRKFNISLLWDILPLVVGGIVLISKADNSDSGTAVLI